MTKSFKRFRSRGFLAKPADHNKTPEGKRMTPAERDARDIQTANNNRQDLSALLELRDIMDELGTITKLLDQQKATITSMLRYYEGKFYGRGFLDAVQSRLDEYRAQVSEMKENAHLAQKAVCLSSSSPPFCLRHLTHTGRNPTRSQTKTSQCRRGPNGSLASRSHPEPVQIRNGLYHLHCDVRPTSLPPGLRTG